MSVTGPADLCAAIGPLAEEMIPGWRVTCAWCAPEDIGGALAMVFPDEKREMATIKVAPHPAGEDIGESVAHELVHATMRPLVALIPESPATIQIEETIAERLGVLLARLWREAPSRARAVIRALQAGLPAIAGARARARISALANRRARGGTMDGKQVLAAIAGQDEAAALKILNDWAAEQLASAGHPGAPEPDGDESPPGDPMAKDPNKPAPADGLAAPPPGGEMRARLAAVDSELARMRGARIELDTILVDSRKGAVANLITSLRARLPSTHKGLPAVEKRILAAGDYGAAKMIHDLALEMAPDPIEEPVGSRARSATPALGAAPAFVKPADFDKFDPGFQEMVQAVAAHEGAEAAESVIKAGRARLTRDAQQGRA